MVEQEYLESLGFKRDRSDHYGDYYIGHCERDRYDRNSGRSFTIKEPMKIYYDKQTDSYSFYYGHGHKRFESIVDHIGGDLNEFKLFKRKTYINKINKL